MLRFSSRALLTLSAGLATALCATAAAAINVSVNVPRCTSSSETCPAPQAVFFDATATTCAPGECSDSFRELHYAWDFGDPGAGNWKTGASSQSKNEAYGPVAFHVWDDPGVYTVTLTVSNGLTTSSWTQQIHVDDPNTVFSGRTRCISPSGDFRGCPSGAVQHHSGGSTDFGGQLSAAMSAGADRILFEAGVAWTSYGTVTIDRSGFQIGVYGDSGINANERATVNAANYSSVFGHSGNNPSHGVFFNLDLNSTNGAKWTHIENVRVDNLLFYRLSCSTNSKNCIYLLGNTPSGGLQKDIFIVGDGQLIDGVPTANQADAGWCVWQGANRFVVAGHRFGQNCERDIRVDRNAAADPLGPGIIAHNSTSEQPNVSSNDEVRLDIRGSDGTGSGVASMRHLLIADNYMPTPDSSRIYLRIVNGGAEGAEDVLIERNHVRCSNDGWVNNRSARRVTVRNNLVITTGGACQLYSAIQSDGKQSWISDNHVVGNSIYGTAPMGRAVIDFTPYDNNGVCQRNVFYNAGGTSSYDTCGGATLDVLNASRHSGDALQLTANPFAGTPTLGGPASQWELNNVAGGGALVLGATQSLPIPGLLIDFAGRLRVASSNLGAMQTTAGGALPPPPAGGTPPPTSGQPLEPPVLLP